MLTQAFAKYGELSIHALQNFYTGRATEREECLMVDSEMY